MKRKPPTLKPFKSKRQPAYKWAVWFPQNGGRKRKLFRTKQAAERELEEREIEFLNLGVELSNRLTDELRREAVECQQRLEPIGVTLTEAVDHFLKHVQATQRSEKIEVLADAFQQAVKKNGASVRYQDDLRSRLRRFCSDFGEKYASEVQTRDIEIWLSSLQVAGQTRNNYRRVLHTFFEYAVNMAYTPSNPVAKAGKAKATPGRIEIFTPEEMRILLRDAKGDILAHLLFGGFAGLRDAEIGRLHWEQVKPERGHIDLSGSVTKTAARRLVTIQPNLLKWLEKFAFKQGPIRQPNWNKRIKAWKESIAENEIESERVAWKANALRHSYASYHMAKFKDAAETAHELGHTSLTVVYRHYREVVEPGEAANWWALTPKAVETDNIIEMAASE